MPEGLFGLARNTSRKSSRGRRRNAAGSDQSARKWTSSLPRALQLGQRLVEDVAGIGQPQQLALADERPRDDRQDVVAAVAAEDPVGLRRPAASAARRRKASASGSGYFCSPRRSDLLDRPADGRRGRIGVLVGVELDELAVLRLFARHVAGHGFDFGSEVGHGIGFGFRQVGRCRSEEMQQIKPRSHWLLDISDSSACILRPSPSFSPRRSPGGRQAFLGGQDVHVGGQVHPGPARLKCRMLLARRKSLADRPLAKRAVPLVGSTCDGPAA